MINNLLTGIIFNNVEKFGNKDALFAQTNDGKWESISWNEFGKKVKSTALALLQWGIKPGDKVGIISRNMPEWTITDLAVQSLRAISVPMFSTISKAQASYILNETQVSVLFVGEQEQYDIAASIFKQSDYLKIIIVFDESTKLNKEVNSIYLSEFLKIESLTNYCDDLDKLLTQASPEDIYTIIYTSGTSGEPKGVMLNNQSLRFCVDIHQERLLISDQDISFCMLPLSHIFERGWTWIALATGMTVYYLRNPRDIIDILPTVKPTIMCAVPRFFEKTYSVVMEKIHNSSALKQKIFRWAIKTGSQHSEILRQEQAIPFFLSVKYSIANLLVLKKGRSVLGGRIRFMPCAGASLSDEINRFFHAVGIDVKYGYGLTETTATVSCFTDTRFVFGSVGKIMPGVEVKIGNNNEILVKAPTVTTGYFNKPEATDAAFEGEWFRTGDAGHLDDQGNLYLTDRIKDIMKTSSGKYIAPQMIETLLLNNQYIDFVSIIGNERKFVTALIVPSFSALTSFAKKHGISFTSNTDLVNKPEIVNLFYNEISIIQKDLSPFEQIKKFTLLTNAFSIESGELTSTLKIRRRFVEEKYRDEIEQMYKE